MNPHRLSLSRIILFSCVTLFFNVAAATAQDAQVGHRSKDLEKRAALKGRYKGFILLDNGVKKRAVLEIRDTLDRDLNNFVLTVEGEEPFSGRLAANEYSGTNEVFANLRFEDEAASFLSLSQNPSISVSLKRIGPGVKLISVEKNKQFRFEPCLPPPPCRAECEPC